MNGDQYDERTILVAVLLKMQRGEPIPQTTSETAKGSQVTRYRLTFAELEEASQCGLTLDLGYKDFLCVSAAPPETRIVD